MRLTKAMKEAIVEDYARHMYFQRLTQISVELTKELNSLVNKIFKPNMDFLNKTKIDELEKFTKVSKTDYANFYCYLYPENLNKKQKHTLTVLDLFSTDIEKGFYLPSGCNLLQRINYFSKSESRSTFYIDCNVKLNSTILNPKSNPLSITPKSFNDKNFKPFFTKVSKFAEEVHEAYLHLDQVSQLVHSVTTDNKLLELIPEMQQFIPNKQSSTALVPIDTINQIKKNLSK